MPNLSSPNLSEKLNRPDAMRNGDTVVELDIFPSVLHTICHIPIYIVKYQHSQKSIPPCSEEFEHKIKDYCEAKKCRGEFKDDTLEKYLQGPALP